MLIARVVDHWESLFFPVIFGGFPRSRFQALGRLLAVDVDQTSHPRVTYELPAVTYDGWSLDR